MRLRKRNIPRLVEASSSFSVFLEPCFVAKDEIIRRCQVEDAAPNISLALPETRNNLINMVDLQKFVDF